LLTLLADDPKITDRFCVVSDRARLYAEGSRMIGAATQLETPRFLRELCAGIGARLEPAAGRNLRITGLTADSREVRPGYLFAAVRGAQADGHDFIKKALACGAVAVLADQPSASAPGAVLVRVNDSREALARLAARWYGLACAPNGNEMRLIGVTGTNGKSTVCCLVRTLMNHAAQPCANIGTIEYDLVGRRAGASLTTPAAVTLARLLAEARGHGAERAALEVSSHALDQRRTDGLTFSTAVFTNLTGDHYDYHGGPAEYLSAKKRLFDCLDERAVALVNTDDPAGERMVADCRARVVRYGLSTGADLSGRVEESNRLGTRLRIRHHGGETEVRSPLVGEHNAYNILAAFGAGLADGLSAGVVAEGIAALKAVPGRLERVSPADCPVDVLVDYAHTDDALDRALQAARRICRARLTVVFGCGGDRDRTKRPRMARTAERADRIVVTSDNPRTEEPDRIIDDILVGFGPERRKRVHVDPDRESAIRHALEQAGPGDLVLIAGKGHEDYQIIGASRRWFDDRVIAARLVREIWGADR
jgi:UDP-N-acetylmuramoyl-L-alanyl-D-glutamate--2,6-diaminopimelate ligase